VHKKEGTNVSKPHGIIIFGANGSGKTTLACEVAHILDFKHMDIEDYAFEPSDIPYANSRTREGCSRLILADIEAHKNFVLWRLW
jgi:SpoVK/Ycf46/Vps4 family AAA+-type ATPase